MSRFLGLLSMPVYILVFIRVRMFDIVVGIKVESITETSKRYKRIYFYTWNRNISTAVDFKFTF